MLGELEKSHPNVKNTRELKDYEAHSTQAERRYVQTFRNYTQKEFDSSNRYSTNMIKEVPKMKRINTIWLNSNIELMQSINNKKFHSNRLLIPYKKMKMVHRKLPEIKRRNAKSTSDMMCIKPLPIIKQSLRDLISMKQSFNKYKHL